MNCSKTERLFLGVADDNNSATAILGDSQGRVIARNVSGSVNYVRYGISQARRNLEELILGSLGCKTENVLDTVCFTDSRRLSFKLLSTRAFGKNKYTNE